MAMITSFLRNKNKQFSEWRNLNLGDTKIIAWCEYATVRVSEAFSKLNLLISGYYDPKTIFFVVKINDFRNDLSDISAKTATLVPLVCGTPGCDESDVSDDVPYVTKTRQVGAHGHDTFFFSEIIKRSNFPGDVTDIWAITKSLPVAIIILFRPYVAHLAVTCLMTLRKSQKDATSRHKWPW